MSAARVLAELAQAGAELAEEAGGLRVRASGRLPPPLLAQARAVKPALLRVASGRWRADLAAWPAWRQEAWEERAALMAEGMPAGAVDLAERCAFLDVAELLDVDAQGEGTGGPAGAPGLEAGEHPGGAAGAELPPDVDPGDPAALDLMTSLPAPPGGELGASSLASPAAAEGLALAEDRSTIAPEAPPRPLPPWRWSDVVPLGPEPPPPPALFRYPHPLEAPPRPRAAAAPSTAPPEARAERVPLPAAAPPEALPAVDLANDPAERRRRALLAHVEASGAAELGPLAPRAVDLVAAPVPPGRAGAWLGAYQRRRGAGLDAASALRLTCTTHGPRPAGLALGAPFDG